MLVLLFAGVAAVAFLYYAFGRPVSWALGAVLIVVVLAMVAAAARHSEVFLKPYSGGTMIILPDILGQIMATGLGWLFGLMMMGVVELELGWPLRLLKPPL